MRFRFSRSYYFTGWKSDLIGTGCALLLIAALLGVVAIVFWAMGLTVVWAVASHRG